ncbi:DUF2079 domain-containing protein [Streptomyces sp. NPDC019531]|uniref:DUF2079 domain-containing protein n=1 Tax=Streptomyces sp. NPDC019531 TaxID=3365062 RepID=UPI00384E3848
MPNDSTTLPRGKAAGPVAVRPLPDRVGRAGWGAALSMALLLFTAYTALSVRLHQRMLTTGYDLGIFEQAVRSYAHGHLPVAELKGPDFPLLGDHFSPVLALLAPVYRMFPTPVTLLVAQAALLAGAAIPLTRWAEEVRGRGAALVVGFGYGTSWGVAETVGFDFHEVCFAVPLLAFSLTALGRGRPRAAALWALPLLLVKEDLGLTAAVVGLLIARGTAHRRTGIAVSAAGVLGSALETLVVIPAFSPGGTFTYTSSVPGADATAQSTGDLLLHYTVGLITPDAKAGTLLALLAVTGFLALRSPLLWAAVPTLLWRFASDNSAYWGTGYHYSAVLMPIMFAGFVDALSRPGPVRHALAASAAVTVILLPQHPLWQLTQPATWRTEPRLATAGRLMDRIPDGATVAASNRLVPHLTSRTEVTVLGFQGSRRDPQWIIDDTGQPQGWPLSPEQERGLLADARAHGYRTVAEEDGYVLLQRVP